MLQTNGFIPVTEHHVSIFPYISITPSPSFQPFTIWGPQTWLQLQQQAPPAPPERPTLSAPVPRRPTPGTSPWPNTGDAPSHFHGSSWLAGDHSELMKTSYLRENGRQRPQGQPTYRFFVVENGEILAWWMGTRRSHQCVSASQSAWVELEKYLKDRATKVIMNIISTKNKYEIIVSHNHNEIIYDPEAYVGIPLLIILERIRSTLSHGYFCLKVRYSIHCKSKNSNV